MDFKLALARWQLARSGQKKIIPICMVLLKERYKALFYTVLPIKYILPASEAFFRDNKWFTDPFSRHCYSHKELLRVLYLALVLNRTSSGTSPADVTDFL